MPKDKKTAKVHQDLEGLNVNVDSMGELSSTLDIDKINSFLNKHVDDIKLSDSKKNKDK